VLDRLRPRRRAARRRLRPSRPGLESSCATRTVAPGVAPARRRTCAIVHEGPINGADTGRCVADDILASSPGAELWASSVDGLFSAESGESVGSKTERAELPDLLGWRRPGASSRTRPPSPRRAPAIRC
jgi:hypothetical protein